MPDIAQAIVDEARTWLGTPFRHQGRKKGQGVDCLGLLIGVADALDLRGKDGALVSLSDRLTYGHYPEEAMLRAGLEGSLDSVEQAEAGSIGLFEIDATARHLGIFARELTATAEGYLTLIHAYAPARKVVEHRFDQQWETCLRGVYQLPVDANIKSDF